MATKPRVKNGRNLDIPRLRQWVFDNWAMLERHMRKNLCLDESQRLELVVLRGSYNYVTKRLSRPFLALHNEQDEYAYFDAGNEYHLAFLICNRIMPDRHSIEFSRAELAGISRPRAEENSSS